MEHALLVEGLSRRFGGLTAVDDVSFGVRAGSVLGIIGPNGAGKTTTFNIIAGDDTADAGEITLLDRRVTGTSAAVRSRAGLARTFQIPEPLGELTTRENVLTGALMRHGMRGGRRRADELVESLGLGAVADVPADRLNTTDGKRMELARALACEPQVLLLDEPVAGLTEEEMRDVVVTIRRTAEQGTAVVIVEHVLGAVFSLCSEIVVLNFGQVLLIGPPAAIRADERVIEAYLGRDDD